MLWALFTLVFVASIAMSCAEDSGYYYPPAGAGQRIPGAFYGNQGAQPHYNAPQSTVSYRTEYYSFAEPRTDYADELAAQQLNSVLQRRVRVVFIKAPENRALEQAAYALAKQSADDKTAIYVLNKQTDASELAQRLGAIREQNAQPPTVSFVKYHTAEEAALAQQQIQAQYDALQGNTLRNSDEGATGVLNFASQTQTTNGGPATPDRYYLPPAPSTTSNEYDNPSNAYNGAAYDYRRAGAINAYAEASRRNLGAQETYAPPSASIVTKINARISKGGKFTFPSDGRSANAYLPVAHKY